MKTGAKGFTLLEVMITVVILGVLATLAVPAYKNQVEKSRRQEAIQALSAVKESQQRYWAQNNAFTNSYAQLDFDPTDTSNDPPGTTRHYTYAAPTAAGTGSGATFSVTATRNTANSGNGTSTVVINQTGSLTYT